MNQKHAKVISVVVPVFNEAENLPTFHDCLMSELQKLPYDYEVIYCNDGSADDTVKIIRSWHQANSRIKLLSLSRNFGKEYALTAGIRESGGAAVLMIDGDGQHPIELIPKFIAQWEAGSQIVVGIRDNTVAPGFKRLGSNLFYKAFNMMSAQKLEPNSTDFRLIDRLVQKQFMRLPETNRLTRGLIDWLGFKRSFVHFTAKARQGGNVSYSNRRLARLATDSFVSMSPQPLYVFGWIGISITCTAFVLGSVVFIEQIILEDPWGWNFTGTAMLGILIVFLVGIVLLSQAILSLYVSNIQAQTKGRPLYIIDSQDSAGLREKTD